MPPPESPREYLFSLEQIGIKLGLEQIRALVSLLDRPDRAYRSVVIAGTNGKGSVAAMTDRGLRAAGYRTARYTSPHLVHLEERMVIDGEPVLPATLDAAIERVRAAASRLPAPPSFFEATTAAALDIFREAAVDVAVLEVGLGGRLDATNVVAPAAVAITSIDFDHEQYLGHTLTAIATEKAGVIKSGAPAVLARNPDEVRRLVETICRERDAPFVYAPDGVAVEAAMIEGRARLALETPVRKYAPMDLALRGRHQIDNAITATRVLEILTRTFPRVTEPAIRAALTDVVWPARLELLTANGRPVLIDGAHNPAGARALASYLHEVYARPLPIIVGVMADKQVDAIVSALAPQASTLVCTAVSSPRAMSVDRLADAAARLAPSTPVRAITPPAAALQFAQSLDSPVVVAGSLYLAGEIRGAIA